MKKGVTVRCLRLRDVKVPDLSTKKEKNKRERKKERKKSTL